LYDEDMEHVIDCMFERRCDDNETIIKEGDNGNYFYVILNGRFKVFKENKYITEYNNTGYFGELALLYNQVCLIFI
jgi:cAMP-dependent protein kinase regulator